MPSAGNLCRHTWTWAVVLLIGLTSRSSPAMQADPVLDGLTQDLSVVPDTRLPGNTVNPLSPKPKVTVQRRGRILELDCDLPATVGRQATRQLPNPRFTVYKDGQEIGGGQFEYG